MRYLMEKGQQYIRSMTILEMGLLKFCLLGLGIVIGASAAEKHKQTVRTCGALMFIISYIPVMSSFLSVLFPEDA